MSVKRWTALVLSAVWMMLAAPAWAETPEFVLTIKDHKFEPAEFEVPANVKVKLIVKNLDPTPEEFESYELNREKVIAGGREAVIFIGPLEPGTYPYFGEFNADTAQGKIIAK